MHNIREKGVRYMSDDFKIPRATLKRLPLYYRFVSILKGKGMIVLILKQ